MFEQRKEIATRGELSVGLMEYEIRVRGRLDSSRWMEWFDDVRIRPGDEGETILHVAVADQSALYGLLSRLRDLAVPLLSVNAVVPPEGPGHIRRGRKRRGRINWLLILVYLLASGGLSAVTVFLTSEASVPTALALTFLFAALGGIAFAFRSWDGGLGWSLGAGFFWVGAVITLMIHLPTAGLLHPALAIAILLLLPAGGLVYVLYRRKNAAVRVQNAPAGWEAVGSRLDVHDAEIDPSERDR